MLSLAIALASITTWNYAGFVADPPAPAPPPPAVVPAPLSTPSGRPLAPRELPMPPVGPLNSNPEVRTKSSPLVAAVPPPEPTRYQMADLSGQVWEHADPAFLQAFVVDRNSRMRILQQTPARRFSR